MQSCGEYGLVLLDVLDCPIKRQFHQDLIADLQLLLVSRHAHWKLVNQPIAEMFHVGAPASVYQHIFLIAGEPESEPIDQAVQRRPRNELTILRAEDADRRLAARHNIEQ